MARHFDFQAPERSDAEQEGPTFSVAGKWRNGTGPPVNAEEPDGERVTEWAETFTCLPVIPPGVLDSVASMVALDDRGRRVYNAPSLMRLMRGALVPEDVDRFVDLMMEPNRLLDLAFLGEMAMEVVGELVRRPTGRQSRSTPGPASISPGFGHDTLVLPPQPTLRTS